MIGPNRAGRGITISLAALLLAALVAGCGGADARPDAKADAPNIIVIMLDDATAAQVNPETMPIATRELGDRGTSFEDYIVTSPLCCPSRANYLTGQYGKNNEVLANNYGKLKNKGDILPRWLQGAGYRTMHVGKFMNGFTNALEEPTDVPAGWDEWYTMLLNSYYDYPLSDNGELIEFGDQPDDYATRVINRRAADLVEEYAGDEPFYMQIDHYAPHPYVGRGPDDECKVGATPDPDDYPRLRELPRPREIARREGDVSDKPWFIRALPPLDRRDLRRRATDYLCSSATLPAVDRGLGMLIDRLRDAGELDDTAIMLSSDNGYFYGEHRIPAKKEFAYEENLRMPLLVRLPKSLRPAEPITEVDLPAANIDLAPTILDLAGGEPCKDDSDCRLLDGRSLLPLLQSRSPEYPRDRALLIELDQAPKGNQKRVRPCSFVGVRWRGQVFIRYRSAAKPGGPCRPTNATEHYDLADDPNQLENLAGTSRAVGGRKALRNKLTELRACEGNRAGPDPGPRPCE